MARMTCQAVLGLGCAAGAAARLHAAEWSLAPTLEWGIDTNSNRYLEPDAGASQSSWFDAAAQIQRATDTTQLSLSPYVRWQRFDEPRYGAIDNLSLSGAFGWSTELGRLDTSASVADYSTLSTELTETGIVNDDLRSRNEQVSATWTYSLSERRALIAQLAYIDSSYYGPNSDLLNLRSGYKYPTASLGEQFAISERASLTVSAFDDELLSPLPDNDSHETGAKISFTDNFSDRTRLDAFVGSSVRSLQGVRSTGTLGGLTFTRQYYLGSVALKYSRTLVPYGTGVLAQQQQLSLSGSYNLTEHLDLEPSITRIENNRYAVLLQADRPSYDDIAVALNWNMTEFWKLRGEVGATRTQAFEANQISVDGWRIAVSLMWTPLPSKRSF